MVSSSASPSRAPFVNKPPILLCDEPTGNLDPTTSLDIVRLLDRINRTGTTIVMATHDDDIVDQLRKRVVELRNGHIVRDENKGVYGSGQLTPPTPTRDHRARHQTHRRPTPMRLQFMLSEIWIGLRRNLSIAVSVMLVTMVSVYLLGHRAARPAPGRHPQGLLVRPDPGLDLHVRQRLRSTPTATARRSPTSRRTPCSRSSTR